MKKAVRTVELADLPNIGAKMAGRLNEAGIRTPAELRKVGSVVAAARVSPFRDCGPTCRSALCALEGAIRGVRWHAIPKTERDDLWKRYVAHTKH